MLGRLGGSAAAATSSFTLVGFLDSGGLWLGGWTPGSLKGSSQQSKTGEDPCRRPVNCSGTPAPCSWLSWELSRKREKEWAKSVKKESSLGGLESGPLTEGQILRAGLIRNRPHEPRKQVCNCFLPGEKKRERGAKEQGEGVCWLKK